jgi:heme-degrading monooxygenase HmoA
MNINRQFIRQLPGFIEDNAYKQTGGDGEYNFVTVAVWENATAINNAKQAVVAEYKREGFDMPAMLARLNIKIDRAVYERMEEE